MSDKKNAGIEKPNRQTNREFAAENGKFAAACMAAEVKPTKRQASKYRKNRGAASKV